MERTEIATVARLLRFFAWEPILGLVILNAPVWFRDPFRWHQVISWILLLACFVPLVFGVLHLNVRGKSVKSREGDNTLFAFERTTELVTTGIHAYIRHPLYSSLLLLAWGAFFKAPSWPGTALALLATGAVILTARADEVECTRFFGAAYPEYMTRTKRFVPYVF